jgi:hypothetical protein
MFEIRYHDNPGVVHRFASRDAAVEALLDAAEAWDLDVHLHPGAYTDSACSTLFPRGGDMFLDAVAVLRQRF